MMSAIIFIASTGPLKQIPALYNHAPWVNDPFDTVISLAIFLIPAVTAVGLVRISLCAHATPLPISRVRGLLRGTRVLRLGIGLTLTTQWIGLLIGENRAQWNTATGVQVAVLFLNTALLGVAWSSASRRTRALDTAADASNHGPDGLADALSALRVAASRARRVGRSSNRALEWIDRTLLPPLRQHPLLGAALVSGAFVSAFTFAQARREGYASGAMVAFASLLFSGVFGLLVAVGSYLRLVSSAEILRGVRRRLVDALVITSIAVLIPFAFRSRLWWLVGSTDHRAGLGQLAELLVLVSGVSFVAVWVTETILGLHGLDARRGARGR